MRLFSVVLFVTFFIGCALLPAPAYAQSPDPIRAEENHGDLKPYDSTRNASDDVDIALHNAGQNGTKALIVMGANWCHDSLALAKRFEDPKFESLLLNNYEVVFVSVGSKVMQKDQNPEIAARFGVSPIEGTPTVVIADGAGNTLNADSAGYWRTAETIPFDMSYAYFTYYAAHKIKKIDDSSTEAKTGAK